MDEWLHPFPSPRKATSDLIRITKEVNLSAIVAMTYNALLFNRTQAEIEKIQRKNVTSLRGNRYTTLKTLIILRIIE